MKICLFCFSDAGAKLAEKLCTLLGVEKARVHTVEKFAVPYGFTAHRKISEAMGALFAENDALIFIGACGIAVREIAPHLASKTTDPAVLVLDDRGRYVIPILSGHIGGAGALAKEVAKLLGAEAVVTTATDGAGKFSCDAFAASHGFAISSMATAKEVSAAILRRNIPICAERALPKPLPQGLVRGGRGEIGVYIGVHTETPFEKTLNLIPRALILGVGCRRGASGERLLSAVRAVLEENSLDLRAVAAIASIDRKADEPGLLWLAETLGVGTAFYTAEELNALEGAFDDSAFVRSTVGTGNVCERAAVLCGGKLIVKKRAADGVTVAVSEKTWRIEF